MATFIEGIRAADTDAEASSAAHSKGLAQDVASRLRENVAGASAAVEAAVAPIRTQVNALAGGVRVQRDPVTGDYYVEG